MSRHVGYPRDNQAGNPPTKSAAAQSSISCDNGSIPQHRSAFVDEKVAAAWCQMHHGDPYLSDETRTAMQGKTDLIGRTWREGREMTRDEKRLMARYTKTIGAAEAETLRHYRECTLCT